MKKQRAARTRNGGTWTESAFFGRLRSALRRLSMFWKPSLAALKLAQVSAPGPHGRKWLFRCAGCDGLFMRKQVQIDHVVQVGSLRCLEDLPGFVERLLPEDPAAFRVLCKKCHSAVTAQQRSKP
jgi:hypothetical protein